MSDPLHVGDHVTDREKEEDGARMVVVRETTETAAAYTLGDGRTVAECNPEYPPTDTVFSVRYPGRDDLRITDGATYAFPRSRLDRVSSVHDESDS